jgi:ligand-binding sensor domain-containing protein
MTSNSSIVSQKDDYSKPNALRSILKAYLSEEKYVDRLTWKNITTRDGLPHNWIYDLFQDTLDRVWVGTWGGGLVWFEKNQWQSFTTRDGLHSNNVTCIREDQDGRLWIATDNGLNILEDNQIADAGLIGKSLLNLTFDHKGNLWAGCWRASRSGAGLYRYGRGSWERFSTRQDLPGLEILKVFTDSLGRVWVGTYEQGVGAGVGCYDGQSWHSFTTRDGLVNDCVYSMFEDPSGNMWFGTISGVSVFDGKTWHTMTKKDGLVDNRVYSMIIDSHKKMWFGTKEGISRFDGQSWISYTKKDGLVENLVRSIIEAKDGRLWFGTYPYAKGSGGISIGQYPTEKSLPDRVLDLLPDAPIPEQLPSGDEK